MPTIYTSGRQRGKTTTLIMESAKHGYTIVCPTVLQARYVIGIAKKLGVKIPEPITCGRMLEEIQYSRHDPEKRKKYVIDELQTILHQLGVEVATIDEKCVKELPNVQLHRNNENHEND